METNGIRTAQTPCRDRARENGDYEPTLGGAKHMANSPPPQILVFRLALTIHIGRWRTLNISLGPPKEESLRPPSVARLFSSRPQSAHPIGADARRTVAFPRWGSFRGGTPAGVIWPSAIDQ
jgi:hypothetical protein